MKLILSGLIMLNMIGCIKEQEAMQMARTWAEQMGYEDARIVCQTTDHPIAQINCSIRTKHASNPIVVHCQSDTGCMPN